MLSLKSRLIVLGSFSTYHAAGILLVVWLKGVFGESMPSVGTLLLMSAAVLAVYPYTKGRPNGLPQSERLILTAASLGLYLITVIGLLIAMGWPALGWPLAITAVIGAAVLYLSYGWIATTMRRSADKAIAKRAAQAGA